MAVINAPWNKKQINFLNQIQGNKSNSYIAYLCPNRRDGWHLFNGCDIGSLIPTEKGLVCPDCDYKQDYADFPSGHES